MTNRLVTLKLSEAQECLHKTRSVLEVTMDAGGTACADAEHVNNWNCVTGHEKRGHVATMSAVVGRRSRRSAEKCRESL